MKWERRTQNEVSNGVKLYIHFFALALLPPDIGGR